MPGCGESEGPHAGNLICLEQVQAASDALDLFLAKNPNVEGDRIGMIGSSFGGRPSRFMSAAVDKARRRSDLVGRLGGMGERKFRGSASWRGGPGRNSPTCWRKGKAVIAKKTGKSLMVPRYDIVPIPQHLRGPSGAETRSRSSQQRRRRACTIFRAAMTSSGNAKGRPILLLHSSADSVTANPSSRSRCSKRASSGRATCICSPRPTTFMFSESNDRVRSVIYDWLAKYLPVKGAGGRGVTPVWPNPAAFPHRGDARIHARNALLAPRRPRPPTPELAAKQMIEGRCHRLRRGMGSCGSTITATGLSPAGVNAKADVKVLQRFGRRPLWSMAATASAIW